jgi:hypothetical protein
MLHLRMPGGQNKFLTTMKPWVIKSGTQATDRIVTYSSGTQVRRGEPSMSDNSNQLSISSKSRVADVLKSSIERRLIDEQDAVLIAGHGSHVVSDVVDPDTTPSQMDVTWDDEKYRLFMQRLTALGEGDRAL